MLNNQRVGAGLGRRIMAKETNLMEKLPEVRSVAATPTSRKWIAEPFEKSQIDVEYTQFIPVK